MAVSLLPVEREPQLLIKLTTKNLNKNDDEVEETKPSMEVMLDVLDQLRQIQQKATVVGIAGDMRSGKSFFMNVLACKDNTMKKMFVTGDSIEPVTKGIWILVVDHPLNCDKKLILLDTEGLGDTDKDNDGDNMIFTMTTLLCTHLIFNMVGIIRRGDIATLRCIADFSQRLQDSAGAEIRSPFFIPLIRDFNLTLKPKTPTQYFDTAIKQTYGSAISSVFSKRKAFVIKQPKLTGSEMDGNRSLRDCEDLKDFFSNIDECRDFIWTESQMNNAGDIECSLLAPLIEKYTTAMNNGVIPHQKDLYMSVIDDENNRLLEVFLSKLKDQLKEIVQECDIGDIAAQCGKILSEIENQYGDKFVGPDDKKIIVAKSLKHRYKAFTKEKWLTMVCHSINTRIGQKEFYVIGGNKNFSDVLNETEMNFKVAFGCELKDMNDWDQVKSDVLSSFSVVYVKRCRQKFIKWVECQQETIKLFDVIIEKVEEAERAQSERQISLSLCGIAAAAISIVGILATPATAGSSLVVAQAGLGIGFAAGVGGFINSSSKEETVKEEIEPINSQVKKRNEKLTKLINHVKEFEEFVKSHGEQLYFNFEGKDKLMASPLEKEFYKIKGLLANGIGSFLAALDDLVGIAGKVLIPVVAITALLEFASIAYHASFLTRDDLSKRGKVLTESKVQMENELSGTKDAFEQIFPEAATEDESLHVEKEPVKV